MLNRGHDGLGLRDGLGPRDGPGPPHTHIIKKNTLTKFLKIITATNQRLTEIPICRVNTYNFRSGACAVLGATTSATEFRQTNLGAGLASRWAELCARPAAEPISRRITRPSRQCQMHLENSECAQIVTRLNGPYTVFPRCERL